MKNRRVDRPERLGSIVALLLLVCAALVFAVESWEPSPQLDDAYISYRYAVHLVQGEGLVYNPGEYVEGITNLLWTLLVAAGIALGLAAPAVAHGLGLLFGVASLVASYWLARRGLAGGALWLAGLAPWLVLASTSFPVWSASGMETPLYVAAVTWALAAYAGGRTGWAAVAAGVATLTRPDGVLVAAALFGVSLAERWREGWRAWCPPAVLRQRGGPVALVAAGVIGSFGYYSEAPIVDIYGLVDPTIARSRPVSEARALMAPGHQRSNADAILARRPDYILIARPEDPIARRLPAHRELSAHPALARDYEWDEAVWGYRRRSGDGEIR